MNECGEGREWHSPLNLTPPCGFNERWGKSRDERQTRQECLCCSLANEKKQWQIFVSQEGPQICKVTSQQQMFWLLINSPAFLTCTNMFVFIHRYMLICLVRCSTWSHPHMNFLKGNKQAVCLYDAQACRVSCRVCTRELLLKERHSWAPLAWSAWLIGDSFN